MMQNKLCTALDTISLTDAQKEKLREALSVRLPEEEPGNMKYHAWKKPGRRFSPAVAAIVLALVLLSVLVPLHFSEFQMTGVQEQSAFADFYRSDLYLAALDWAKCLKPYEKYGVNGPSEVTAMPYPYRNYRCYTLELAEDLDAICEKYGLSLIGEGNYLEDYKTLLSSIGTYDVLMDRENVIQTAYGGWYYSDGSYRFGGETIMSEESLWSYPVEYEFHRIMKTTFHELLLDVVAFQKYDTWEYTTSNGVSLLLAKTDEYAYLFGEAEDSVLFVRIVDQNTDDDRIFDMTMSREELEAFAETFDFAVPVYEGEVPPEPNKLRAMEDAQIYIAPSTDATVLGNLRTGEIYDVVRIDSFMDGPWALLPEGWVKTDAMELYYEKLG